MRLAIATVCGLFVSASLLGCGGAAIPKPPENARPGPPPGSSPDLVKVKEKEKSRRR